MKTTRNAINISTDLSVAAAHLDAAVMVLKNRIMNDAALKQRTCNEIEGWVDDCEKMSRALIADADTVLEHAAK